MGEACKDALRVGFDRAIKLEFHGARVSSDAGLFPYRDLDEAAQLTESSAAELFDFRTGNNIQHSMAALLRQSIYSRLAGYEDVNDRDELRLDPLLATVVGKADPTGSARRRERDQGKALAGKSTLNRLEGGIGTDPARDAYKRVGLDEAAVKDLFVELFLEAFDEAPETQGSPTTS